MTGCYPKRAMPIRHVLFPCSAIGLRPNEITIAEVLKQQGYATGCVGKWHLGDQREFLPTRQGFDYYFGLPYSNDMGLAEDGARTNADKPVPEPRDRSKPGPLPPDGYRGNFQTPLPLMENEKVIERVTGEVQTRITREYTEKAVEFIAKHKDKPFFLYLPHSAVHFPLYPGTKFLGSSGNGLFDDWVQEVDWSAGEVLKAVRDNGIAEKTLVIFTSDNGGAPRHGASNAPLRGGKASTWEGGVRVPTIFWWPGKIKEGTSTDAITSTMDVLPTLAALAGGTVPGDRKIDGFDIWPVIEGDVPGPRNEFLYFRGYDLQAVRKGPWKLHIDRKAEGHLFNLVDDIGESQNVAGQHPDVVADLEKLVEKVESDLGIHQVGPGCRPLGLVQHPKPLIKMDGSIQEGFEK